MGYEQGSIVPIQAVYILVFRQHATNVDHVVNGQSLACCIMQTPSGIVVYVPGIPSTTAAAVVVEGII